MGILESGKLIAADVSAQLRTSPFLPFRVDWPDETARKNNGFLVGLRVHNKPLYEQSPPRKRVYKPGLSFLFKQGYQCYKRKRRFLESHLVQR